MKHFFVIRTPALKKGKGEELAFRLLARRDYSQEEMRQKLLKKGISSTETEEILKKLLAAQLLDDLRYAQRLVRYYGREKLWGSWRIIQKLKEKGIAEELAKEVVDKEEKNLLPEEKLRILLKKKLKQRTLSALSPKEVKKLSQHLYRQGYGWEDIVPILKEGGFAEE